jgi:ABC-type branched-subunit amino acid transport system ATPase component
MSMLTISGLNQFYGSSHTLRDVSLTVSEGACTVVLGRNGVGKTTLLKCLVGLLPVKTGVIGLAGHDLTHAPSHKRVRAGLGYVPQGRDIFPLLSVEENLRIGAFAGEANGAASARHFPFSRPGAGASRATSPAASSSNSPSGARCSPTRSCSCSTSQPKAFSRRSSRRSRR